MEWNSLDVILGILFAFFSLRGLFRGFVEEFFSVGAVVLGLVGASLFGPTFAKTAEELLPIQGWGGVVSFLGTFLVLYVVLKIVQRICKNFIESVRLQSLDKALGLFLGVLEGVIILVVVVWGIGVQPVFNAKSLLEGSLIARFFIPLLPSLLNKIPVKWI